MFTGIKSFTINNRRPFKTCLKSISSGHSFPGRREDFETESAWQHWRTSETSQIQQLILTMLQANPELARSSGADHHPHSSLQNSGSTRPVSVYSSEVLTRHPSAGSRMSFYGANGDGHDDFLAEEDMDEFTYIPPNPRKYYRRLVEYSLIADLETMLSPEVDDNDEVSLGILSAPHIELINECALRWRIGHPYRAACFLDLVKQFFERNDVPMECIPEALQAVAKVISDTDLDNWPTQDVSIFFRLKFHRPKSFRIGRFPGHRIRRSLQHISFFPLSRHGFSTRAEAIGRSSISLHSPDRERFWVVEAI